jgi:hypothetical protein
MESKNRYIKNKTILLNFNNVSTATSSIVIPYAVDRIIFRSLANNGNNVTAYAVLSSDLIQWEAVGIVYRDSSFSNSTAQTNEYHFQTPTNINGTYNFRLTNFAGAPLTGGANEFVAFIAEFIRDKDGVNGHTH